MAQTTNTVVFDVKLNSQQFDDSMAGMKKELAELENKLGSSLLSPKDQQAVLNRMGTLKKGIEDLDYAISNTTASSTFENLAIAISPVNTALLGATAAAGLFTDNTEKIAKIQQKVNILMSVGMALQELKDLKRLKGVYLNIAASTKEWLLQKLQLSTTKLQVISENSYTGSKLKGIVATKAATVAQRLWNAAMYSNPIGIVIGAVVSLIAVITTLTLWVNKNTKAQIEYNDSQREMIENSMDAEERYDEAIKRHKILTGLLTEEEAKMNEMNDERNKLIELIKLEEQNYKNVVGTYGVGSKKLDEYNKRLKNLRTELGAVNVEIENYNLSLKQNTEEILNNDATIGAKKHGFGTVKITQAEYDEYYGLWLNIKKYIEDVKQKEFVKLPLSAAEQVLKSELQKTLPELEKMTIKELFAFQANLSAKFMNASIIPDDGGDVVEGITHLEKLTSEFNNNNKVLEEQLRNGKQLNEHLFNRNIVITKEINLMSEQKKYLEDIIKLKADEANLNLPEWSLTPPDEIDVDQFIEAVYEEIDALILLEEKAEEVDRILNPEKYENKERKAATNWQERLLGISEEDWEDAKKELKNLGLDTLGTVISDRMNQKFEDDINQMYQTLDDYYSDESEKLEQQRTSELITEEEYQKKRSALEDEYKEKQREYKKEEFKKQKEAALYEIGIQTAVAVMKALPNLFLAGMVTSMGIAQAAIVAARPIPKYAKGGILGDGTYFRAGEEGPEAIINNKSTQMFKPLLSEINEFGGGVSFDNRNSGMVIMSKEQWNGFLNTLNNRPVKAYVTERDISFTQKRVNRIKQTARL